MTDMVRIKPDVTANNTADRALMEALGEVNAATFLRRIQEAF